MESKNLGDGAPLPPLPQITEETQPFWDSAREGLLKLQRCTDCLEFRFPPSVVCPACSSMNYSWEPVSGSGSIFSFVAFQRLYHKAFASLLPYVIAVIELSEGPRMVSRLVGLEESDSLKCGAPVKLRYERLSDDLTLPLFELLGERG